MNKKLHPDLAFFFCYLGYMSIYISRVNLSMAGDALKEQQIATTAQIGALGLIFSIVYACGRLLNGILGDRIIPAVMISTGLIAAGLSNAVFSFLPAFPILAVLWGVNAYGQSMLWSSMLKSLSALYEPLKAKKQCAILVTAVATGNIAGILLNMFFIERFGLRFAFLFPGIFNLVMAPILFFLLKNEPFTPAQGQQKNPLSVLRYADVRQMLIPAFCHGVMKDNITLWMTVYIVDTFAVDLAQSSWYVLLIPTVGLIGRFAYSLVSKLCKENEHVVSIIGFILCVIASALLLLPFNTPLTAALLLSLVYAAVSMINTSVVSIFPMSYSASGQVATVSGLIDAVIYLGAGIGSALYGVAIEPLGYGILFQSWIVLSLGCILVMLWILKKQKQPRAGK